MAYVQLVCKGEVSGSVAYGVGETCVCVCLPVCVSLFPHHFAPLLFQYGSNDLLNNGVAVAYIPYTLIRIRLAQCLLDG